MERAEAIKYLVGNTYGANRFEALYAVGITPDEVVTAGRELIEAERRLWAERMSPHWRGEEMGV